MTETTIAMVDMGAGLAFEAQLLAEVALAPEARFFWLWQADRPCLVAPRKFSTLAGFAQTAARLADMGWPVHLRGTGGDVTPQGPGVINVTHVYASVPTKRFDLDAEYGRLCAPIEGALGPGASRGWQAGAFCDGAHNVQWQGRKFAGTAMRFRPCRADKARTAVLAHALMLMAPPAPQAITALNTFLAALDQPRVIQPQAHTGLPKSLPQGVFCTALGARFEAMPDLPPLTPLPALR